MRATKKGYGDIHRYRERDKGRGQLKLEKKRGYTLSERDKDINNDRRGMKMKSEPERKIDRYLYISHRDKDKYRDQ
jgi:hypothetical protein